MVALVTGADGFIGRHLCAALRQDDWMVRTYDLAYGDDCLNPGRLKGLVKGVDTVFHLAAQSDVRESDPDLTFRNGVIATQSVLEAMRLEGVAHLVYTSSGAVYGDRDCAMKETDALAPNSPYAGSKAAAEMLIRSYVCMYGMDAIILRLANVVGPGMTRGVTYDFIHRLMDDPAHLAVLGNGEQLKSYIHVRDVVEVMRRLHDHPLGWDVFNVATIDRVTAGEIAHIVAETMDLHPSITYDPSPVGWPGDIPSVSLDSRKLRAQGWTARYGSAQAVRRAAVALVKEATCV